MAKIRTPQEQADIDQFAKWFSCSFFLFLVVVATIFGFWFVNTVLGF